jgi:hypothetical protein
MKKKLLVLMIAVIPTLMPNLVSAVAIDSDYDWVCTGYDCSITHSSSVRESGVN